jgi:hypothetical protein
MVSLGRSAHADLELVCPLIPDWDESGNLATRLTDGLARCLGIGSVKHRTGLPGATLTDHRLSRSRVNLATRGRRPPDHLSVAGQWWIALEPSWAASHDVGAVWLTRNPILNTGASDGLSIRSIRCLFIQRPSLARPRRDDGLPCK